MNLPCQVDRKVQHRAVLIMYEQIKVACASGNIFKWSYESCPFVRVQLIAC